MIIDSSYINLYASHEKTESSSMSFSLSENLSFSDFFQSFRDLPSQTQGNTQPVSSTDETSETSPSSILIMTDEGLKFRTSEDDQQSGMTPQEKIKNQLFQSLLEAIGGRRFGTTDTSGIDDLITLSDDVKAAQANEAELQAGSQPFQPATMKVSMSFSETISEYECTEFSSCGVVRTADGKEIDFAMDLKMERSYSETREYSVTKEVTFTDPLIINFEGEAADLSNEKFSFDLDADGSEEMISYLQGSGAMLALDKNNDGVINDGTELFGALSGDGFADLAQYDEDGNGYIDEGDSIFADLQLWTKTVDEDKLESLADRGIGAIYLGSAETPFDLKGEDNQINGRVRSTGFYLTEAGGSGAVQQVDMVV